MKLPIHNVEYKRHWNVPFLSQGHKAGSRPRNGYKTLGGSNGTYVQIDTQGNSDILVWVEKDSETIPVSIGKDVRRILNRKQLTAKLARQIDSAAPKDVEIEETGRFQRRIPECELKKWLAGIGL